LSLLQKIQESVVEEGSDLSSILLKLRLIAARLGSDFLEDWVKHESEGYPKDVEVPSYRIVGLRYTGIFSGPFGSGIQNAQIPPYIIEKHAGDIWTNYKVRESVAAIEDMVSKSGKGGSFGVDASDLILVLQGKVYQNYSCIDIQASMSPTAFFEIQQCVRSRILELTLELEKSVPGAMHVAFGSSNTDESDTDKIQQISQQIIYGNVTTAVAGGAHNTISIAIHERDNRSFIEHLEKVGIPKSDAHDLVEIMQDEEPESIEEPFGQKAKDWIAQNIKKAADGSWKVGVSVASKVLTEAALKYYGLK
jgi:hypothetical protein